MTKCSGANRRSCTRKFPIRNTKKWKECWLNKRKNENVLSAINNLFCAPPVCKNISVCKRVGRAARTRLLCSLILKTVRCAPLLKHRSFAAPLLGTLTNAILSLYLAYLPKMITMNVD